MAALWSAWEFRPHRCASPSPAAAGHGAYLKKKKKNFKQKFDSKLLPWTYTSCSKL